MESTPTEYKKIVYDSKAEAVFARALDLAGQEFIHHPGVGRHPWDFLVFPFHTTKESVQFRARICGKDFTSQRSIEIERPSARPMLIEFKPAEPAWTYVSRVSRCVPEKTNAFIVWGSPWRGPDHRTGKTYNIYAFQANFNRNGLLNEFFRSDQRSGRVVSAFHDQESTLGITEKMIEKALTYRFDLQQDDPFSDKYFDSLQG